MPATLWTGAGLVVTRDSGVTLLVSSHVMDEAARCDHVLLMRDGALLASGPPKELLARTGQPDL
jgi:ABC-2 type transport system ATP-binding protein